MNRISDSMLYSPKKIRRGQARSWTHPGPTACVCPLTRVCCLPCAATVSCQTLGGALTGKTNQVVRSYAENVQLTGTGASLEQVVASFLAEHTLRARRAAEIHLSPYVLPVAGASAVPRSCTTPDRQRVACCRLMSPGGWQKGICAL